MGEPSQIYLFGDQTFDYAKPLRDLVHSGRDALLVSFFEKTSYALRSEIGKLSQREREAYPRFANFAELVAYSVAGSLHPALDQALTCAYQLASFISLHDHDRAYPSSTNTCVLGACTGALAAAAVCSSATISGLVAPGVQSVVAAFRIGLRASQLAQTISPTSDLSTSDWSLLCLELTPQDAKKAITAFSEATHVPLTSQPYVSAVSDYGVTISGRPSSLSDMYNGSFLDHARAYPLSIKLPYHAPHLFCDDDVKQIMSAIPTHWAARPATIAPISGSTGEYVWADSFLSLLRVAVEDVLLKTLHWNELTHRRASIARAARGAPVVTKKIGISADSSLARSRDSSLTALNNSILSNPKAPGATAGTTSPGRPEDSKIAIIGASGRFPGAEDMDSFWELLYEGRDMVKEVPPLHWDAKTHVDPTGKAKNTSSTPFGCWLDHPELFDAKFFNISPREAPQVDPAQRLALLTAYEAIEEAGIVPGATPSTQKDRVGVFYGVTSNDWMETNSAQAIDTYFIPGGNRAFIPGRINYCFKFSGPSFSIDTACSSSLAAIHTSCNALWRGEIDTAIAGGTNVLTNPDFTAGLDRGHFLSRTGNCKTFDDTADGYCRGEGIGTVILKRLEDAIADKDPIQGIISGAYTNHSADAVSITRPHIGAQLDVFRKILNKSGTDPSDIGYVEMHGTGTQAGDGSEMQSVLESFAPDNGPQKRTSDQALFVGSAKANIGHGEAASGVASLAKILLMMKHNTIPPHCGIKTKINHTFPDNMAERQVFIAKKPTTWKKPSDGIRKVFLNNFSAAGGNTALLLEDAPQIETPDGGEDVRSNHVVAVSAKCAASLRNNASALLSFLGTMRQQDLPQLSWTTTARRIHHPHRVMVHGADVQEVRANLQKALEANEGSTRAKSAPSVMFAFTGQGSAYSGMAKELYENFQSFCDDISRFDALAQALGFSSFKFFFTAAGGDTSKTSTLITQLAIVALEMALARLWISWGIAPQMVVGHSLGEYAALNVAGVLSDADVIYLVGKRAQLLQDHQDPGTHAMLAIRASSAEVKAALGTTKYEVACINGPKDVVISSTVQEIQTAQQVLAKSNTKATLLSVPYAFHSAQVDPVLSSFEQAAQGVSFRAPSIPILSPLHAKLIQDEGVVGPKYLSQHCRKTVDFLGALRSAQASGTLTDKTVVLEVGPAPTVSGMIKATMPQVQTFSALRRNTDTWNAIAQTVTFLYAAGTDISWREYHRDFKSSHRVLKLPAYKWDLKGYWMQYVHDWSLRKGDAPLLQQVPTEQPATLEKAPVKKVQQVDPTPAPSLLSTTIHRIVEEKVSNGEGSIIVESDISRPDLNPMVQGHKVNGIPLCTPSVYADIALALGDYLRARYWPEKKGHSLSCSDMVIEKALIAAPRGPQLLRAILKVDGSKKIAKCRFATVDASGKTKMEHAGCTIRFEDPSEIQTLRKQAQGIQTRVEDLRKDLQAGKAYAFNKPMIYKMVSTLAQFDPDYQAMNEVVLNSSSMEASSVANFADIKKEGVFHTNPAWIDALSQTGGFVMNANDKCNLELEVFVNHGWESFQLFERLSPKKRYQTHVAMSEGAGKMWHGDIFVFDEGRLVAFFKQIALQGVPRRLLHMILSTESKDQTGSKGAKEAPKGAKAAPVASKTTVVAKPSSPSPMPSAKAAAPVPAQPKAQPNPPAVKPKKGPPAMSQEAAELLAKAVQVIADESGIALDELTDSCVLADIGVDSLLILMITSRFKDELGLDIELSDFFALTTMKEVKARIIRDQPGAAEAIDAKETALPISAEEVAVPDPIAQEEAPQDPEPVAAVQVQQPPPVSEPTVQSVDPAANELFGRVLDIISDETGIATTDFSDDTAFADVGVDSLLILMISGRLQEELDLDIAADGQLFVNCKTVKDLRAVIAPGDATNSAPAAVADPAAAVITATTTEEPAAAQSKAVLETTLSKSIDSIATTLSGDMTPPEKDDSSNTSDSDMEITMVKPSALTRRATSVILQGRPWASTKTLFLFPDGAGSASSYAGLPKIHSTVAAVGLNCPFVRSPQEMMTCSLDDLMKSYLDEVRRRQTHGPYNLGGWSAGGILAYRAAQILIESGETVESLVLIDSPLPKGLDRLPQRFYDHLDSIGLFGKASPGPSQGPPQQLFAHFNATIEVLHHYHATPLPSNALKRMTVIWAAESVMDGVKFAKMPPGPDDTEGMRFLTESRTDFSAAGWDKLGPGAAVEVKRMDNAHHFSMLGDPHAKKLSQIVCAAMGL